MDETTPPDYDTLPSPEHGHSQLDYISEYLDELVEGRVAGQGTPEEAEYVHSKLHGSVQMDGFTDKVVYDVPSVHGERRITIAKRSEGLEGISLEWEDRNPQDVRFFEDESNNNAAIVQLIGGGEVEFVRNQAEKEAMIGGDDSTYWREVPDQPGCFVKIMHMNISDSHLNSLSDEGRDEMLQLRENAERERREAGFVPTRVGSRDEIGEKLLDDAVVHLPEQLGAVLAGISQATGVQPFHRWLASRTERDAQD